MFKVKCCGVDEKGCKINIRFDKVDLNEMRFFAHLQPNDENVITLLTDTLRDMFGSIHFAFRLASLEFDDVEGYDFLRLVKEWNESKKGKERPFSLI